MSVEHFKDAMEKVMADDPSRNFTPEQQDAFVADALYTFGDDGAFDEIARYAEMDRFRYGRNPADRRKLQREAAKLIKRKADPAFASMGHDLDRMAQKMRNASQTPPVAIQRHAEERAAVRRLMVALFKRHGLRVTGALEGPFFHAVEWTIKYLKSVGYPDMGEAASLAREISQ